MFLDLLLEGHADLLGSGFEVPSLFAAQIDAFHRNMTDFGLAHQRGELISLEPPAAHLWDRDDVAVLNPLAPALDRPKTPGMNFKEVEGEEPVWEGVIRDGVPGVAPFAKEHESALEAFLQSRASLCQPWPERVPLGVTSSRRQVVSAALGS